MRLLATTATLACLGSALAQTSTLRIGVRPGFPANPCALVPFATSAPITGAVWDPYVDHASFVPTALLDVLLASPSPANVLSPIGGGTLLCDPVGAVLLDGVPGAPFAVGIAAQPGLVGAELSLQAASLDAAGSFWLTNALDVEVAAPFVVGDVEVGDPTTNYVNPEISPTGNYMVWIELSTSAGHTGNVWQCGLDPDTGDLIPPDGRGFSPFASTVYGRPADWGVDSHGPYYVGLDLTGRFVFVRPTAPDAANVTTLATPPDLRRRVIYPSQLPTQDRRLITFIRNENVPGGAQVPFNDQFELRLLDLDQPLAEVLIETRTRVYPAMVGMDAIVPRWVKGTALLTFGGLDAGGRLQAREFAADAPTVPPVFVTADAAHKPDANTVWNQATGWQYLLAGLDGTSLGTLYRRAAAGQTFVPQASIAPPIVALPNPALQQSHEPFFHAGLAYSTFQVNEDGGSFYATTFDQPGEIWLTTIDHAVTSYWLLSAFDASRNVAEPEPFVGNGKVWVFYSATTIAPGTPVLDRQFHLRRCETPMNG